MRGAMLEKKTWCLHPFPEQEMAPVCVAEFWTGKEGLLAAIRARAVDPILGLASFSSWIDALPARYPGRKIVLISNNPVYDIGTLDYVLAARRIRTLPLRFLGDGKYRSVHDPSEMIAGQGSSVLVREKANVRACHDHWPENDAEHSYWLYVYARRVRLQLIAGRRLEDVDLSDS
jgi:hypothetical protein